MASSKILLRGAEKLNGTFAVFIRVTHNRKTFFKSTGYSVRPNQFKEGLENWIIKHPDAVLMNRAIEAQRSRIMEAYYRSDIEGIKVEPRGCNTFLEALKERQAYYEKRNQVNTYYKLNALRKNLTEAWGEDVPIRLMSALWVEKYVSHQIKKGGAISSIKKDLSHLSRVWKSVSKSDNYFADAAKVLKADDPKREKLELKDIKELEKVKLSGLEDLARDMYLFSFYTHGMRFQNVAMFEETMIKKGMIQYRMNKGKKLREIQVHKKLAKLISKYKGGKPYLFPLLKTKITSPWEIKKEVGNANALINSRLKRVAIICGIETRIHFHSSRHVFAALSLDRGVSLEVLKDALGHSSYQVTQQYAKSLSDKRINDAVKGLYD